MELTTETVNETVNEPVNEEIACPLATWVANVEQNGILQGTPEWKLARRFTIGGSNIATIMGENNYRTVKSFITDKVRGEGFAGNLETNWGNLFEPVIKDHAEHTFNCKIIGENMFINGERSGLAYSPDGLAMVGRDCVLFEFKCPFSRMPNGKIPHHYIPQVKMGLAIINLADKGLYMEGVFRRCSWAQLGWNRDYAPIDTFRYGKTFTQKIPESTGRSTGSSVAKRTNLPADILAMGMIGFYCSGEHPLAADVVTEFGDTNQASVNNCKPIDLGGSSSMFFSKHMSACDNGSIKCRYYNAVYPNESYEATLSAQMDTHVEFCKEMSLTCCGILSWKLFAHQTNWVEKDHTFLDKVQPKVDKIADALKKCYDPDYTDKVDMIIETLCAELYDPPVDDDCEYA